MLNRNEEKSGGYAASEKSLIAVTVAAAAAAAATAFAQDVKLNTNQMPTLTPIEVGRRISLLRQTGNTILYTIFMLVFFSSSSSCFATPTPENEIFYVVEPFDSISDQWFKRRYNDQGKLNLTVSTLPRVEGDGLPKIDDQVLHNSPLFGNGALRVEYQVAQTENWGGFVDFGWILNSTGVAHNCYGATHLSLWYKILQPQSVIGKVHLRLILMDDSDCTLDGHDCADAPGQNLENYYSFHYVLDDNDNNIFDTHSGRWQELRIELRGNDDCNSPFWRTGWTGEVGNNNLDAKRLRGWRIELSMDGQGDIGDVSEGVLLLDQLTCVGGGDLLGAAFHPKEIGLASSDQEGLLEQSLVEGMWFERYYESDQSKNFSQALLTSDGTFRVNYTIEQVETWGGFLDYQHLAPGNAYYNLSQSTHLSLNYDVSKAASVDRAHLRIILMDGSDCTGNCDIYPGQNLENYYSFNNVLNDDSLDPWSGRIVVALEGNSESSSPFWRPGWTGVVGNNVLDGSYIKGFRFELNMDAQGDVGSLVSGIVALKDLSASSNYSASLSDSNNNGSNAIPLCVGEAGLLFNTDDNLSRFRRIEFQGSKCCEICWDDINCTYAQSIGVHCYVTSYLHPDSITLSNTEFKQSKLTAYWMDDISKRGEFCSLCTCNESNRVIDCREQDLVILPKTFSQKWKPKILDLRYNARLHIIGSGALSAISDDLQELRLPIGMRYVSNQTIKDLKALKIVSFEGVSGEDKRGITNFLNNAISNSSGFFGDKCCGLGAHFDLVSPSDGLTFCNMEVDTPGIDSFMEPFVEYNNAERLISLRPTSSFMAEAADSPEKCAEYCSITARCKYFSYDARRMESENTCNLLRNNGKREYTCCREDHYADDEQTAPGWTSGQPPRTRYDIGNATILINLQALELNFSNHYKAQFSISLGSMPTRGAVWVEPKVVSYTDSLDITISPMRVALYDNRTVANITVEVLNADALLSDETIVLSNVVDSCDIAFTLSNSLASETSVYISVISVPRSKYLLAIIIVPLAVAVLFVLVYIYVDHKKRTGDRIWSIKRSELKFDEPPEIIGRGTFGLVLLAEYRGTQVAVKRVIPPRVDKRYASAMDTKLFGHGNVSHRPLCIPDALNSHLSSNSKVSLGKFLKRLVNFKEHAYQNTGVESGSSDGLRLDLRKQSNHDRTSSTKTSSWPRNEYSRLKIDFIREMRFLSKLRHPCITTVMGAVVARKEEPMLVMEYMDHGSLYDLLHNDTMLIEGEQILPILRDIAHGLRFLHAAKPNIIHGDLKAQNILVDSRFRAKVADFGLSQKKRIGGTGTPFWMAPELLRNESHNTMASDVYSFGIILYEVYSRREPYEGECYIDVLQNVADPSVNKRPPYPPSCPQEIRSFMSQCLSGDPADRPTFKDIDLRLKHLEIPNVEPGKLQLSMQAKKEKELTDTLLFEVFPQHIAIALRDGKKVEPEMRQIVTIFFSDIVGFTKISSSLSAIKVSYMLDRLYSKFDEISIQHDVFKVETIGDAYMAATNLVKDQVEHTSQIAQFSIDALKAAKTTLIDLDNPEMGFVNIRVGFHSGPVVANVVGSRNPRYCLFGDTVNTASRMESNSEKNRIHCSERAAILLKSQNPGMSILSRGYIEVKGKGQMKTYWVNESFSVLQEMNKDGSMVTSST